MDGHRVPGVILPGFTAIQKTHVMGFRRRNRNGRIYPRLGIDSKLQYEAWVQAVHVLSSSLPMSINIIYVCIDTKTEIEFHLAERFFCLIDIILWNSNFCNFSNIMSSVDVQLWRSFAG